jgi:hypothetical protein
VLRIKRDRLHKWKAADSKVVERADAELVAIRALAVCAVAGAVERGLHPFHPESVGAGSVLKVERTVAAFQEASRTVALPADHSRHCLTCSLRRLRACSSAEFKL